MKFPLSFGLFFAFSLSAAAGPFGIEMGQPLSELDVREEGPKPFLNSVPNPHPDFELYAVWASEETGVCSIVAISKEYTNDKYGDDIRDAITRFTKAFDKKYGPHKTVDLLRSGALWDGPDEWVMSIRQSERFFGAYWEKPQNAPDLSHIEIQVIALNSDDSVIKLFYQSDKFSQCEAAIAAEANSSF